MKKRIKVFESGKYPQDEKEYDKERIEKIFGTDREINAIFQHTSKWRKEGKEPVVVGYFNNFNIEDVEDKAVVYADLNFNEKGERYYNDNILKGVSAEIPCDYLTKIAVLPVGVNPQIRGAEFEEEIVVNFEEIETKEEKGVISVTREEMLKTLTKEEVMEYAMRNNLEIKEKEKPRVKTEDEIRQEVKAEYEKREKGKVKAREFMENNKLKITPAMKEKGLNEDFIFNLYMSDNEFEFNRENENIGDIISKIFEKIPNLISVESAIKEIEYEEKESNNISEIMKKAKEEAMKRK